MIAGMLYIDDDSQILDIAMVAVILESTFLSPFHYFMQENFGHQCRGEHR